MLSQKAWDIPLSPLLAQLPPSILRGPVPFTLAFGALLAHNLVLLSPCTPGWKAIRAGIISPVILVIYGWIILCTCDESNFETWGVSILLAGFCMRVLEYLVFFPPEEHCHRIVPQSQLRPASKGHAKHSTSTDTDPFVPEPVPPPFTWAKFCWAASLWWSYRGIGWNTVCPLPSSSLQRPYTRSSGRLSFLARQTVNWVVFYLIDDLCKASMYLSSASAFFTEAQGIAPPYTSLSQLERAWYSTMVAVDVWFGLLKSHIVVGCLCVAFGGLMGWESEMFAPWGWPPLFGSLSELWKHPGLSTMWSRTWQGYNRRWLYVLGWIGIGENLLGLTHTGVSAHPSVPPRPALSSNPSTVGSDHPSGHVSPAHPLPSAPPAESTIDGKRIQGRRMSPRLMLQNLVKSFIVFVLSGLVHDAGSLSMIMKLGHPKGRHYVVYLSDVFRLTPFFMVQPVGLAVEAMVKSTWRGWKAKRHPEWKRVTLKGTSGASQTGNPGGGEPAWLVYLERAVGFAWTWIWLGWTARWWVEGLAQLGRFRRGDDPAPMLSVAGGLFWGKWYI
ncbi:hypothetical protein IAU60_005236 [Kwoniella sp. DSM 27419]